MDDLDTRPVWLFGTIWIRETVHHFRKPTATETCLMSTAEWNLDRDGFCMLHRAVDAETIQRLAVVFDDAFEDESLSVRARSSRGHVYAVRNLIDSISEVATVWQVDPMLALLREKLGDRFGFLENLRQQFLHFDILFCPLSFDVFRQLPIVCSDSDSSKLIVAGWVPP